MTLTAPQCSYVDLSADSVVVWSPPKVTIRGTEYAVVLVVRPEMTYDFFSIVDNHRFNFAYLVRLVKLLQSQSVILRLLAALPQGWIVYRAHQDRQRRISTINYRGPFLEYVLTSVYTICHLGNDAS